MYQLLFYFTIVMLRYFAYMHIFCYSKFAYYVYIQFYFNGDFHASDTWLQFSTPFVFYDVTTLHLTMNVVQLPNKVTSFIYIRVHSFLINSLLQ